MASVTRDQFQNFFDCCVGSWTTERTYHYLTQRDVERSHTEFVVHALEPSLKAKVLEDNQRPLPPELDRLPGYHLAFETLSEKGEAVSQALNMLFVPSSEAALILEGDYLRDRAYEESKPMVARFRFNAESRELLMTTTYTKVISVDSITLVNPTLRIRRIINYQRPPEGQPLETVVLVGFGVEQKKI